MRAFILRRVALISQRLRRRDAHRLDPLRRDAAAPGVLHPQRPPVHVHRRRPRHRGPGAPRPLPRRRRRRADRDLPRREGAQEPDERGGGRLLRPERRARRREAPRPGRRRRGARRARGGRVRRVRGARRAGARERTRPGGQAGTSSKIENYLGFPTGISGQALAGARVRAGAEVRRRDRDRPQRRPLRCATAPPATRSTLSNGSVVALAQPDHRQRRRSTGSSRCANLARFEGVGVYYGATAIEAQLCGGDEVVVVGGANSAGQAAVFLAGQLEARPHAGPRRRARRDDVALPHPAHRGEPEHHACDRTRDRRPRGGRRLRDA